jgi:hypothetical protein
MDEFAPSSSIVEKAASYIQNFHEQEEILEQMEKELRARPAF